MRKAIKTKKMTTDKLAVIVTEGFKNTKTLHKGPVPFGKGNYGDEHP